MKVYDLLKKWVKNEMQEVLRAKGAFILTLIIAIGIAYYISSWRYGGIIELYKTENEQLKETGPVPQAVKELETKIIDLQKIIIPISVAAPVDPISGKIKFGNITFETALCSNLDDALDLIKNKKYDLAISKAKKMDEYLPFYLGGIYVRFLINQAKEYNDEAAKQAKLILKEIPEDYKKNEIKKIYSFMVNYHLSKNNKKEAEDIAIKALNIWPEDEKLFQSFEEIFKYRPTISENE